MFKLLFRWKKIKKSIKEMKEAYESVQDFLNAATDIIQDKELKKKLSKAKIEMIEAKQELRKIFE